MVPQNPQDGYTVSNQNIFFVPGRHEKASQDQVVYLVEPMLVLQLTNVLCSALVVQHLTFIWLPPEFEYLA